MARGIRLLLCTMVVVGAGAQAQACSDDGVLMSALDGDAGRKGGATDGSASANDADLPRSTLRLAHLARDVGTIDFCYQAARAGAFEGPVLRGGGADPDASTDADADADADADLDADAADAGEAGAPGLAYATVTKYFTLEAAGTINLVIVPAGATSCASPLAEGTVTLDPGKLSTVALFSAEQGADGGDAGAPPIVAFTDDRDTKADRARVRMIHGADADALSVRVSGATSTVLAERLEPRKASSSSQSIPVDALGFATVAPVAPPAAVIITPFPVDGGVAPETWASEATDLDLRGDSLHTGFVLSREGGGFEILWCADKSTTAELTACSLLR